MTINSRHIRKLAWLQIAAIVQSLDLEQAFGSELHELTYESGCDWVETILIDVQAQAVKRLTPKQLR